MNAILGLSEILSANKIEEYEKKEYRDILVKSSKKLLSILDNIIEISKLEYQEQVLVKRECDYRNEILTAIENFSKEDKIINYPAYGIYNFHPADLASGHGAGPRPFQDLIERNAKTSNVPSDTLPMPSAYVDYHI